MSARPARPWWVTLALSLCTLAAVLGLLVLGLFILILVSFASSGSNK